MGVATSISYPMNKNKNYNDEDEDEDVSIMLQAIYLGLTPGGVVTDGEPAPPHPCSIITQVCTHCKAVERTHRYHPKAL